MKRAFILHPSAFIFPPSSFRLHPYQSVMNELGKRNGNVTERVVQSAAFRLNPAAWSLSLEYENSHVDTSRYAA